MKSLLFENGKIYTMNPDLPVANNMMVIGEVICGVNMSAHEIEANGKMERVDLNGQVCMPGFHDSHMHLLSCGIARYKQINLSKAKSVDELIEILKKAIEQRKIPKGSWVIGYGWNQESFIENRMPTKFDLDLVSKEHNIYIKRICSHIGVCNSRLLKLCGITADTYLNHAEIIRHPDGKPTGILTENALELVNIKIPVLSSSEMETILLRTCDYLSSLGLTTIETDDLAICPDMGFKKKLLETYARLRDFKMLKIRILQQVRVSSVQELKELLPIIKNIHQDDWFATSGIKLILDGSLGGMTAAMRKPYLHTKTLRGNLLFKDSELFEIAQLCREEGLGIICHAIGDKAIDQFIQVISGVFAPEDQPRPRIVHCQICHEQQLEKLSAMSVGIDIQPLFTISDMDMVPNRISWWQDEPVYGWKSMLRHGLLLSGGSDAPVEHPSPILGIDAAVNRTDKDGNPPGGWKPEERLSLSEAVSLYTRWAAEKIGRAGRFGMIKESFAADLVILGAAPTTSTGRFRDMYVKNVYCGGANQTVDDIKQSERT